MENIVKTDGLDQLAKAVVEVIREVKGIDKDMTVGSGSYSYKGVSDKEVKSMFNNLMGKHGLCLLPIGVDTKTSISTWMEDSTYNGNTTSKQKQSVFTEATTKYLLLHTSGQSVVLAGYGQGIDSGDKGAGKATTYAMKYTLLYTFLVATGKIDDSDNEHSENLPTAPVQSPPKQSVQQPTQQVQKPIAKPTMKGDIYQKAIASDKVDVLTQALTKYDLSSEQIIGISKRIAELKKENK